MRIHQPRKFNWFAIGIFLLPLTAVLAYFWAMEMFSSLEDYRSPLHDVSFLSGDRIGEPITKRVVIVLMDALRLDTSFDSSLMPTLNSLREHGASATMVSRPPSFSAPGWTTLLTGAWPDINDSQSMNPPDEYHARTFTQDDIFAAADRASLKTAVFGYSWFEEMLSNSGIKKGFFIVGEDAQADSEVVSASLEALTEDYQLVLIHIDQIDYAGHHEGGPMDSNWGLAASRADNLLLMVVEKLDLDKNTLMVVSDHGQIDKGGHGGNEQVTLREPFVASGVGIIPGTYAEIDMVDVAPTLATLLGTSIPSSSQGRPLMEMLDLSSEQVASVMEIVNEQQSNLLSRYAQAIEMNPITQGDNANVASSQLILEQLRMGKLAQERVWRNMIALFLLLVPGYIIFMRRNPRFVWTIAGVIVFLGSFLLRFLLIDKNTIGFSWIPGQMEYIFYVAQVSGISFFLGWILSMVGQHGFNDSPRQAASISLGYTWMAVYILMIPILLNFAVNGISVNWTLPEFTTFFLGLFSLTVTLFICGFGLIFTGIGVLIIKLRAYR